MFSAIRGMFSRKSAVAAPISAQPIPPAFGLLLSPQEMTPARSWMLYKNVSAFAKCVDMIADNVASLVPLVQVGGRPVADHEARMLLERPGFNRTRRRLVKELAVQYLVTGTSYLHAYGNPAAMPVALDVLKTQFVKPIPGADGWPESYLYAERTRTITFSRDQNPRDPRYLDMASNGLSELVPIYDMDGDYRGVGLPRLNAIRADVELRMKGVLHNASLLDKGARLSGIASFKDPLDEDQKAAVAEQMRAFVGGYTNAGGIMVTSAGEVDFVSTMQSARDMDFMKLMEAVEDAIAARLNIPVTLFRTSAQTNNNYETAWNVLYDQAVLPTFQIVYQSIAALISERTGEAIEIVHDALTSPILARQASARARELFGGKIITRNEARVIAGYEPVLGGDKILEPMGLVPVAEDMFTEVDAALGQPAKPKTEPKVVPTRVTGAANDDQEDSRDDREAERRREKSFRTLSDFLATMQHMRAETVH